MIEPSLKSSRLEEIFTKRKKCFIPFVTAGHPDLESTRDIVLELVRAGSDIVEIGIPFSDPIADGPVIQKSSFFALEHDYGMDDYINLVKDLRQKTDAGLLFMTYLNPVLRFGLDRLDREASQAGLDAILISDLTPEEYLQGEQFDRLETIFLAAPTSSNARIQKICQVCSGFVYLVARTGVTGKQTDVSTIAKQTLHQIRACTDLPVAIGFGIRSQEDVRRVWECAQGAIVGSAIVRFIQEHRSQDDLPARVGDYVRNNLIPVR